jgi:5'-methylthioadenosine phosphorylase
MTTIGIIGGTGLYDLDGLESVRQVNVDTPFGSPSDALVTGTLDGLQLVFVPRHGRGHRLTPSEVPYRANIFALKSLGAEWVISVSAVGSLDEGIHPGDVVTPDQLIDRTRGRPSTFFGDGIVAHVAFGDPICKPLSQHLHAATRACDLTCHAGGTYVCMEGPAFSTRAESNLYRSWGASVIGMTALPEAKLAREAEMHYATIALVTDYDCWHQDAADVDVDAVLEVLKKNAENVRRILKEALPGIPGLEPGEAETPACGCADALQMAIVTDAEMVPAERKQELAAIVGRYLG